MAKQALDMEHLRQLCLQMVEKGQLTHEENGIKIRIKGVQTPQIDKSGWGK